MARLIALVALVVAPAVTAAAQPFPAPPAAPPPSPASGFAASVPPPAEEQPPTCDPTIAVFQAAVVFGGPARTRWDRALEGHGHLPSERLWGGDVTAMVRVAHWLYLGGRAGVRQREWPIEGDGDASATGGDLLFVSSARLGLGRAVAVGLDLGAGFAHVSLGIRDWAHGGAAARFHAGLFGAYRVGTRVNGLIRLGWDAYRLANVNRYGHDVDLGGLGLWLGVEVRR